MRVLIVIIIWVVFPVITSSCFFDSVSSPFNLKTKSPKDTYTVQLKETIKDAAPTPSDPYSHKVHFSVSKKEQAVVSGVLYNGDDFDSQFLKKYPKHTWVSDNILKFGGESIASECDEVLVYNASAKAISFLQIFTGRNEMFLLLELQPKSSTKLCTLPQTDQGADLSWIGFGGQLASEQETFNGGVNFNIRGKYTKPARYCVTIKDDDVEVRSQEFEGFKLGASGGEIKVPKSSDCEPIA